MSYENKNENKPRSQTDVLAFNTIGAPLTMGAFIISKDDMIKNIQALAATYINGDFHVQIDTWVDTRVSEYDETTKSNKKPQQTSFQVWIPKTNKEIISEVIGGGDNNAFIDGVPKYNEDFKKFVNMYGIVGEKGNALAELGKKNKYIIIVLDPNKLFTLFFDARCIKYNELNPNNKCIRPIEVSIQNLYDNENPIEVLTGKADKRKYRTLTGFLVKKYYANIGNGQMDTYRPALDTRRKKYL